MILQWAALALAVLAGASLVYFTLRTGISPVPSNRAQRDAILAALGDAPKGPICELGAGWGTLACAIADRHPTVPVIAFELSWLPWLVLKLRARPNLEVRRADFLKADLRGTFVCYLYRGGMAALKQKLDGMTGFRLITHTFSVHGWTPESEQVLGDFYRTHVFVYRR